MVVILLDGEYCMIAHIAQCQLRPHVLCISPGLNILLCLFGVHKALIYLAASYSTL